MQEVKNFAMELPFGQADLPFDPLQVSIQERHQDIYGRDSTTEKKLPIVKADDSSAPSNRDPNRITQEPSPSTDSEPGSASVSSERRPSIESRLAGIIGGKMGRKKSDIQPSVESPQLSQALLESQLEAKILIRSERDLIPIETNFVNGITINDLPDRKSIETKLTPADESPLAAAAAWLTGTLSTSDSSLNKRILITPDGNERLMQVSK
jgi:hypothetical protein